MEVLGHVPLKAVPMGERLFRQQRWGLQPER
jgi:hypothetical protein